jgi:hypothetical protein
MAVLGAYAGLFWEMGGGQVRLRPEIWHEQVRTLVLLARVLYTYYHNSFSELFVNYQ